MPRQEAKLEINQFIGGLNTDSTELTTPPNTSVNESNFNLTKEGTRRRRFGFDLESATVTSLIKDANNIQDGPTLFISNHRWENADKQPGVNFEVIQTGNILRFYDSSANPLVPGVKAFTVDLDNFKAPFAARTDTTSIGAASGKGVLFIVGESINPFFITYNSVNDTISTTQLNLKIRDLSQLDTSDPETQSATITNNRKYDLLNQGWYQEDVIIGSSSQVISIKTKSKNPDTTVDGFDGSIMEGFREIFGVYPPKTKPWWVGKGTVTVDIHIKKKGIFNDTKFTKEIEAFSKEAFDLFFGGNTVAPLGHFIVNPFNKDRSAASGLQGLAQETTNKRPNTVAFFGGRVFYGLDNTIYFSQIIFDDLTAGERCHQDADPTAEDTIGLIGSDGGVITVPDMSDIVTFFNLEGALLVMAKNGIWSLFSPQGRGFSATDFTVDFVTNLGPTGQFTVVNVEGFPFYWGEKGIYRIQPIPERIAYQVVDISDQKIKNFYDDIPPLSKQFAKGAYDLINKRVIWLWKTATGATNRFLYDNQLNYSLVFDAFFPYNIVIHASGGGGDKTKGIAGIVNANAIATVAGTETVVIGDTADTDSQFSLVQFYYPLSISTQFQDRGPVGLADATPNGIGAIATRVGFPLGSGYQSTNTTTFMDLPTNALPNSGTANWTVEFWYSNSNTSNVNTEQILLLRADNIAPPGTANSINIQTLGGSSKIQWQLHDNAGVFQNENGITIIPNNTNAYISMTRNGNSVFCHVNGVLDATFDVTGKTFNWPGNGGTVTRRAFKGTVLGIPGFMGELRWTNTARYSSASFTPPTNTGLKLGGGVVQTMSLDDVIVSTKSVTDSDISLKYIVLQNSQQTVTAPELGFGNFTDSINFKDWFTTTFPDNYTSFIETFYHLSDDAMLYMQAPWVYAYIKNTFAGFPVAQGDGIIVSGDVGGAWAGT